VHDDSSLFQANIVKSQSDVPMMKVTKDSILFGREQAQMYEEFEVVKENRYHVK